MLSSVRTQTQTRPPDEHEGYPYRDDEEEDEDNGDGCNDIDADAAAGANVAIDDEDLTVRSACCAPIYALTAPVEVGEIGGPGGHAGESAFFASPFLGPLLFQNETSDARDHCANERTFLSYLRIAIYLAVLSVAITLSFHLKNRPTDLERRMAKPLGIIFWALSVVTLVIGLGNYMKTVNKYSRRVAIVQSGWRTQLVLGMLAGAIIGTCVVLLIVERLRPSEESL
ncbi:AP-2 complex subunit sigma [Purpureocillium lavendulum]|uniref:AP-2 complex subunit sigma n=1 Tax=Purpureocillium lavendulum TaxID=1247861 RepID=A0AB34G0J1_9HYPO|nr:AP-2 complex subunit sigma [Purpureocillium lavendulum]